MKKLISIFAIFLILGCNSRKKLIEKELIGAQVERIAQVEIKAEKKVKKDSVITKNKLETKIEQNTNLHVEYDPKKNDSLEVIHTNGADSIRLKIQGNGIVIFDFKKAKTEAKSTISEIFGSQTLFNIDSTSKKIENQKVKIEAVKSTKEIKSTGFSIWIYVIIGASILLLILLWYLFGKPKKLNNEN